MVAILQKLKSLNPFKKVITVSNKAPFAIIFMASKVPMPDDGGPGYVHPLHLDFVTLIRSDRETGFNPAILDRGPNPPQHVYVFDTNDLGYLNSPYLALGPDLLRNNAQVTIDLNRAERQLFVVSRAGTRLGRTQALVKVKFAYDRLRELLTSQNCSIQLHLDEHPAAAADADAAAAAAADDDADADANDDAPPPPPSPGAEAAPHAPPDDPILPPPD